MFEIICNGTTDGIGDEAENVFESREQAEAMIEQLKAIGPDWADAEYEVREVVNA